MLPGKVKLPVLSNCQELAPALMFTLPYSARPLAEPPPVMVTSAPGPARPKPP